MEVYIPNSANKNVVKNLIIAAHKDDGEMIGLKGIYDSMNSNGSCAMIVLTDGGGCPTTGKYSGVGYDEMVRIRTEEQKKASEAGKYNSLYLLERKSTDIKKMTKSALSELVYILRQFSDLDTVYIHNPFDNHPTHQAAAQIAITALRELKNNFDIKSVMQEGGVNYLPPKKIIGVEVWGSLDWLPEKYKYIIDTSEAEKIADELMGKFVSQNYVKKYDVASKSRRYANATFYESHNENVYGSISYGIDLTDFVLKSNKGVKDLFNEVVKEFSKTIGKKK